MAVTVLTHNVCTCVFTCMFVGRLTEVKWRKDPHLCGCLSGSGVGGSGGGM